MSDELALRQALVTKLRASAPVIALVPPERIYGEQTPASPVWPFVRMQLGITTLYESSCVEGSEIPVQIDAFAYGPGADSAWALADAIRRSLDDADIPLPTGYRNLGVDYVSTRMLREPDREASAWHAVIEFNVTIGV